jgi:hypothetical protein
VLCHHALDPALVAFSQKTLAIVERLGMQKTSDARPADQMTKSALAVFKVDGAQVVAVELHEIEGPEHEVILDALVRLSVELLEPVRVHSSASIMADPASDANAAVR